MHVNLYRLNLCVWSVFGLALLSFVLFSTQIVSSSVHIRLGFPFLWLFFLLSFLSLVAFFSSRAIAVVVAVSVETVVLLIYMTHLSYSQHCNQYGFCNFSLFYTEQLCLRLVKKRLRIHKRIMTRVYEYASFDNRHNYRWKMQNRTGKVSTIPSIWILFNRHKIFSICMNCTRQTLFLPLLKWAL